MVKQIHRFYEGLHEVVIKVQGSLGNFAKTIYHLGRGFLMLGRRFLNSVLRRSVNSYLRSAESLNLKVFPAFVSRYFRKIPGRAKTGVLISSGVLKSVLIVQAASKKDQGMTEVQKAEELYEKHEWKELYEYLLQFNESDDPELLWRLVRAGRDYASNATELNAEEKKGIIFEMFYISKKALEKGEENFACHKWYGIMLSQTGDYLGTKKKIEDSPAMKKHFERAIELNPTDSTSHHLMGMWCYSFADLAWFERKIAAVVFGSPPESTYEEAYKHFEKSEECGPSAYSTNQYMLGSVALKMGKKDVAKEWFEKLLKFPVVKTEDTDNIKKAEAQLKSL